MVSVENLFISDDSLNISIFVKLHCFFEFFLQFFFRDFCDCLIATLSMASSASASSTPSFVQDFSNPYFIHANENPSNKIVTTILDGSNYHGWAQAITMVFEMKNKLGFIDGTIQTPIDSDPNLAFWKRCNNLIRSWINHSVTPEIATSVIWLTQVSDVWNALRNRFSQGDYIRILQLHSDLYSLKQGDLSIMNYFTKVKILWVELCNFRPIPSCDSSTTGSCKSVVAMQKYRDTDSVLCFLQGLNDPYNQARSQILMLDPMPSLDKVFSIILQQERHMNLAILSTPAVLVVQSTSSSQGHRKGYSKQGQSRHCTHCGINNHTVDTCFVKHGLPPGWKSKKGSVHQISAFGSSSEEWDFSDVSKAFSGLSKAQFASLIALFPDVKPTATAASSVNLVSSHNICAQPSSDEYMPEDDWYC